MSGFRLPAGPVVPGSPTSTDQYEEYRHDHVVRPPPSPWPGTAPPRRDGPDDPGAGCGRGPATPSMAVYCTQRATAGLIISEGVQPSPVGRSSPGTPGLYTDEQVVSWRPITDAVHANCGRMDAVGAARTATTPTWSNGCTPACRSRPPTRPRTARAATRAASPTRPASTPPGRTRQAGGGTARSRPGLTLPWSPAGSRLIRVRQDPLLIEVVTESSSRSLMPLTPASGFTVHMQGRPCPAPGHQG